MAVAPLGSTASPGSTYASAGRPSTLTTAIVQTRCRAAAELLRIAAARSVAITRMTAALSAASIRMGIIACIVELPDVDDGSGV
ncbi:MAG: hypothetical protein WD009_00525 [Phycisphaeraceae bacterium]